MRIQIVMSLVGRLLYIFGVFTLIPFIYSVVFETAYWSFLITTSLSLVLGTLLSYYGCESQSFSIRDGFLVVSSTWIFTVILGALPFLGSGILTNVLMLYLKPLRVLLQLVQLLFIVLMRYQTHLYCGVVLCTGLEGWGSSSLSYHF